MKYALVDAGLRRGAVTVSLSVVAVSAVFAQSAYGQTNNPLPQQQQATEQAQIQEEPQPVEKDKMAMAAELGSTISDLVYTPITPCRIVDTRVAGGAMVANVTRAFDVDGTDFSAQGGSPTGCGIPYGVARAVEMTIQATQTTGTGYFKAWQVGAAQPVGGVLNFNGAGVTIANNAAVPVVPGVGADFYLWSSIATHAAISVVGYYAPPVATALDCITVSSPLTVVHYNAWTNIDISCPAGRTATGGGFQSPEGTLGRPNIWIDSVPIANGWRAWVDNQTGGDRSVQSFARCCRVPGR